MTPQKEYALFCEFASLSHTGMHSYMHVFDRTTFKKGTSMALRGFFATRLIHLPENAAIEFYVTDSAQNVIENGTLFKGNIKGPAANVVARIPGLPVNAVGEYKIWARIDGGEPMHLCSWESLEQN